jgi:hypothetical protein
MMKKKEAIQAMINGDIVEGPEGYYKYYHAAFLKTNNIFSNNWSPYEINGLTKYYNIHKKPVRVFDIKPTDYNIHKKPVRVFDIKPTDWVLCRDENGQPWRLRDFSHIDTLNMQTRIFAVTTTQCYKYIVKYDGNSKYVNKQCSIEGTWSSKEYYEQV